MSMTRQMANMQIDDEEDPVGPTFAYGSGRNFTSAFETALRECKPNDDTLQFHLLEEYNHAHPSFRNTYYTVFEVTGQGEYTEPGSKATEPCVWRTYVYIFTKPGNIVTQSSDPLMNEQSSTLKTKKTCSGSVDFGSGPLRLSRESWDKFQDNLATLVRNFYHDSDCNHPSFELNPDDRPSHLQSPIEHFITSPGQCRVRLVDDLSGDWDDEFAGRVYLTHTVEWPVNGEAEKRAQDAARELHHADFLQESMPDPAFFSSRY